jgi:hypothetical protein
LRYRCIWPASVVTQLQKEVGEVLDQRILEIRRWILVLQIKEFEDKRVLDGFLGSERVAVARKLTTGAEMPPPGRTSRRFRAAIAGPRLIVGAREQFMKLDVHFGLLTVLLLGFSADTIKNLFSKRN